MATFHVYVEGTDDPSPAGLQRVAQAVSQRFGLSSDQLVQRLAAGRFRVKANVDRVTAESFVRALAECGARASIEASDGAAVAAVEPRKTSSGSMPPINVARKASPSQPPPNRPQSSSLPPATQAARPQSSSLPPSNRPQSGQLPAQARTTSKNSMQSGLSAAFGTNRAQSESEFSALGEGALSLASLDGDDAGQAAGTQEQFAPAVKYEPPPATPRTVTANKGAPAAAPLDLFRPPDAEEAEALVDIAADEVAARAEKADRASKASLPPANVVGNVPLSSQRFGRVDGPITTLEEKEPSPIGRFAAGVLLAILLGFVPAHLVASSRETSAFRQIDTEIERTQQSAISDEDQYKALDGFRAGQLAKKQAEKKSIAMMAMAIWAVAAAAVAYGFFFRVPWDKLDGKKPEATA
ncbi:MAG TPA: hypothetical protein VGM39_00050 [Kofleriaceae bacterium]